MKDCRESRLSGKLHVNLWILLWLKYVFFLQFSVSHCHSPYPHVILHRRMGASAPDMRRELSWPTLASRRAASETVAVYQSVSGCSPDYLSTLFQLSGLTHQHATRLVSCRGILVPQVRTELKKRHSLSEERRGGMVFQQVLELA